MIVPPSLLFQYQLAVPRIDGIPRVKGTLLDLPEASTLFVPSSLQGLDSHLQLRLAWNTNGLGLRVDVGGKKLTPSGRRRDLRSSDHIQVFVDTRHTANVHRATEYCSAVVVLPSDDDEDDQPTVAFVEIAQQRVTRNDRSGNKCRAKLQLRNDGYSLELWLPASQLPGFADVAEIGHLGFYLIVEDTELGQLPLSIGGDFPVSYDPSTWLQLHLLPA